MPMAMGFRPIAHNVTVAFAIERELTSGESLQLRSSSFGSKMHVSIIFFPPSKNASDLSVLKLDSSSYAFFVMEKVSPFCVQP